MTSLKDVTRYSTNPPAPVVYEMPAARPVIRSLIDTLFRRWRAIAALCGLFTLIFLAYSLLTPRKYVSEMTLLVKSTRSGALGGTEGSANDFRPSDVSDAQLATEVQLLSSRDMAGKVIDAMGTGGMSAVARSRAITTLQKDLRVAPLLKSNMIQVRYSGSDAATSAHVLELLSSAYLDRHLELHSNTGSLDFFNGQSTQAADALKEAQSKLLNFQQSSGAVSAVAQKDLYLQKLVELEVGLHQAEAEFRDTQQRVAALEPRLASVPARVATQSRQVPNQYSVERMNTLLTELRNRRTELLTKFPDSDRMVAQVDQQIADTQGALAAAERRISTEEASDINPLRQTLEGELDRARTTAAGLSGRLDAMRGQQTEYREQLNRMESLIPQEQELTRNVKIAEENYLLYARKREESRIGEQMDNQKLANVIVAEPPRVPALPEPRFSTISISAYLLGVILCTFLALAFAQMRRIVYTPWEVESNVALPVLGTVPAFRNGRVTKIFPQSTHKKVKP